MMPNMFDSENEFVKALEQVDLLIQEAQGAEEQQKKYLTYNKANMLLLLAKFENFLEQIVEEYIDCINNLRLCAHCIPEEIKLQHSICLFDKSKEYLKNAQKAEESKSMLVELGELWKGQAPFDHLEINAKFNYGKHGDKEINKIFYNAGIDNIFDKVKIYEQTETMLEESPTRSEIDIKSTINSMINMRNNIIHADATPDLTHRDIIKYRDYLRQFSKEIAQILEVRIQQLSGDTSDLSIENKGRESDWIL